ncbi:MAG TPA: hypothetical protein VGM62_03910 [Chthoniobacterales bacterium]|jgi:hypothetical protein
MKILHTVFALALFSAVSPAQEGKPEQQRSYSPDKRWEFRSDVIVRAGSTGPALQLSDKCGGANGGCEPPLWSPDSKRFALNAPDQGRYQPTSFYQLNGDEWKELPPPPDAISDVLNKVVFARMKKMGLPPKKTPIRLISNPIRTIQWTDPDTALVYASDVEAVKDDPDRGFFEASFLFTLKFDQSGQCKIVKSQRLSDKEREKYKKKSEP